MALTKEMVMEKMKEKDVVVLNVLPEPEYRKLHIQGSGTMPWGKDPASFAKAVERIYGKNKFFITHCSDYACQAGPNAARALASLGFRAEDYPGGIKEWFESGYPVEGTESRVKPAMR